MTTTLSADEKRAIGEFLLFVGRRALAVLANDIVAAIEDRIGDMPPPVPGTLHFAAHSALYRDPAERIHALWSQYFPREFHRLGRYLEQIQDPGRLGDHLFRLSSEAMDGALANMMHDFVALIPHIEARFQIALGAQSRAILAFLTLITSEQNIDKLSTFFDLSNHRGRMNADMRPHSIRSRWCTQLAPIDPVSRAAQNEAEWAEVRRIMALGAELPLHEVLASALRDIAEYFTPRRMRDGSCYDQNDDEAEKYRTHELFYTLSFHPIFREFWARIFRAYPHDVLRGEIDALIRSKPALADFWNAQYAFYSAGA
jgi:hypothetical protein